MLFHGIFNMVIILNIVDKIPLDKNIKLYRVIQNIICPNIINGKKYKDIKLNDIDLRIFDPNNNLKIIIYIHGGGWVSGNLDTHSNICYELAKKLNRKVISIGYRLAPEYPFPTGLNDCYMVIKNIMENIDKLNIKCKDVIIMGDSAGANLAMAVSLMGLHNKTFRVGKIIMIYPTTQTDYSKNSIYKSLFYNDNKGFLTRKYLENWTNMYLPDEKNKNNQYVNLMKAKRLFGLPKTLIVTGTNDPLHDEGIAFVKKLKRHLVCVQNYDLKNATHGFFSNIIDKKWTDKTIELIKGFTGDKIE